MNENLPKRIGGGNDIVVSDPVFEDRARYDSSTNERKRDEYRDSRYKEHDTAETDNSYSNYDDTDSTFGSEDGTSGGNWNPNSEHKSSDVYKRYSEMDSFAIAQADRIGHLALSKSGLNDTAVIHTAMTIRTAARASGLIAATRYASMSNQMRLMQDVTNDVGSNIAMSVRELYNEGKIVPGQFNVDVGSFNEFTQILDDEVFSLSGIEISKLNMKELKKLINSNELQGKALEYAKTSLTFKNQIAAAGKLKGDLAKQKSSVESLAGRLMGNDVDVWNGSQYILSTYRSIKRIVKTFKRLLKKVKDAAEKAARSAASATKTSATYGTQTALASQGTQNAALSQGGSKIALTQGSTKAMLASSASGNTGVIVSGSGAMSAAGGTGAAVGSTAGSVGGVAATGGAAGGAGGGIAAGGAAAGGIVALVVIVIIIIVVLILGVVIAISGTHEDKTVNLEETVASESSDSMLYNTFLVLKQHDSDLVETVNKGLSISEIKEKADNKSVYANYTIPLFLRQSLGVNSIPIQQGKDANGNLLISSYNGSGVKTSILKSNAREILCASTVVVENAAEDSPLTFKRYAENLWYSTHHVSSEFLTNPDGSLKLSFCDGSCMQTYTYVFETQWYEMSIEDPNTGEVVTFIDPLEYHYYLKDSSGNVAAELTSAMITDINKSVANGDFALYQGPLNKVDTNCEDDLRTVTEREWKICAGHAAYQTKVITYYAADGDKFFSADTFTCDPENADFWNGRDVSGKWYGGVTSFFKNIPSWLTITPSYTKITSNTEWNGNTFETCRAGITKRVYADIANKVLNAGEDGDVIIPITEEIRWAGWTDDNKEWFQALYEQDWYDIYGINFSTGSMGGSSMDQSQIDGLVTDVSNETTKQMLSFALGMVGKIPYYWGGKQIVSERYIDHADMTVEEFLDEYYPHLGTTYVTANSTGNPTSVNGWYGCGGMDGDRGIIGLDCSGFTKFAYANIGINIGDGTSGQKYSGAAVSFGDLKPGDLLINDSDPNTAHVVMFVKWEDKSQGTYIAVESTGSSGVITRKYLGNIWEHYRRIIN